MGDVERRSDFGVPRSIMHIDIGISGEGLPPTLDWFEHGLEHAFQSPLERRSKVELTVRMRHEAGSKRIECLSAWSYFGPMPMIMSVQPQ